MSAFFLFPYLQHPKVWPLVAVSLLLGIGYAQWPNGKPLRNRHWFKTLVVPLVWVFVTVVLPGIAVPTSPILLGMLALERFCFIFAITVPFDLRDAETDAAQGIKTIANQYEARSATRIALIVLAVGYLIFVSMFLLRAHVQAESGQVLLVVATMIYTLAAALVWRLRTLHHDYWYSGVLDGLLVFWAVALI
jgi:4-hydroxybenzoate polyprenyltransferase